MQHGIAAGLERNHKRQRILFKPGFLQEGIDVQVMSRKDLRQPSNDSRLVAHKEAQIPCRLKIAGHDRRYDLARDLAGSLKGLPRDLAHNPKYMEGFGE